MIDIQLLSQVPLFSGLPEDELQILAGILTPRQFAAGELLCLENDPGDEFYVIQSGQIEVIKALGTAGERILNVRGRGEFLGEMSFWDRNRRRSASLRAKVDSEVLEMTYTDFEALLLRQSSLALHLLAELSRRLSETDNAALADLLEKNRQLEAAYLELKAAQAKLVEKEKLEHELQVAREIQESMLPRTLPEVSGFSFGARMVPARAVGGDVFDFIQLGPGRVGILVGDVSDKGIPAALFMALTRSIIRVEAARDIPPAEVLQNVNHHLLDMNEASMFFTVLYGILEAETQTFHYARAGHEVPIVFDARGKRQALVRRLGQPLGIFAQPEIDVQRLVIPPGGVLLLGTDGFTEAILPNDRFFQLEAVRQALFEAPASAAQETCDQLLQAALARRQNGEVGGEDDITLVLVKNLNNGESP